MVVPPPVVKPPQVLKCTIGATGCFTSNQEKVCIATSTGSDWAYSTCSVGSNCNAPNTRCTKNAVSSTPTECNPLNCVPTATECSLNNGVVDSQKSCLGGLTGVCCSVAMKQQIPTLVAGQMCLAGLAQCNCPKQNGQNVSVPGGVRCPKLADGNTCTNASQCITNVCNVTCGGVTPSTNSAQCIFGVSSCSALGKYPSTSCSICPSGVASCCGDTIPASEIKCQIGASSCVNATTVRACTPTATGYDFKTFACASGVCSSATNKCVAPQPVSTTPKTCVQIVDAMTCGYTPNCTWNNNRCAEKTIVATYDLGTCTTPCPISGACFCPANCNKASISLGTGGTCGGQKAALDCTTSTNRISCALNSSCSWVSSSFFSGGICINKPAPITSCTQVCDSKTGLCQCPQSCSNASTTPNGSTCGGTKITSLCPAGQWQCGNQCADGATQSSFSSVWCNGKGRWLSESQSNQRASTPELICSGADASIQKIASNNCSSSIGQTSSCSQFTNTADCQAPGRACQYDSTNNKCIPLFCIADNKVKPSNSTTVCCSGSSTYTANSLTYCGQKPKVLPTLPPVSTTDPSTQCEKFIGNKTTCSNAGCQYFTNTGSCVVKGDTDSCQGGPDSCNFGGTVGSSCVAANGSKGYCGRTLLSTEPQSCACKNSGTPTAVTIPAGSTCPSTVTSCACQERFISPGQYCQKTISVDSYCSDSRGCYCLVDESPIPFGSQCRSVPGLKQWIERTNALRQSCSTGSSSAYDCAVLGFYQLADAATLGGVDIANKSVQAYIACTQDLVAGRRKDCLKEAIAAGSSTTFVADFFVGFGKLLVNTTSSTLKTISTDGVLAQAEQILPKELADSLYASGGKITPDIFRKFPGYVWSTCPTCETELDLLSSLQSAGQLKSGMTPADFGFGTGGGVMTEANVARDILNAPDIKTAQRIVANAGGLDNLNNESLGAIISKSGCINIQSSVCYAMDMGQKIGEPWWNLIDRSLMYEEARDAVLKDMPYGGIQMNFSNGYLRSLPVDELNDLVTAEASRQFLPKEDLAVRLFDAGLIAEGAYHALLLTK